MRVSVFRHIVMLLVCVAVLLSQTGCAPAAEVPEDAAARWKEEYEALNGEKNKDGKLYPEVYLPEGLQVSYPNEDEVIELFQNGTGILYFGFPECPWCRTILPILAEIMTEQPEVRLYCYDLRADRDEYQTDEDGEIRQTREGTEFYSSLLSILDEWIGAYQGLNDESIKRIYMPTLVFLKDGVIQYVHLNTIDGQKSGYDPLTDEQREELKSILEEAIRPISQIPD